MSDNRLELAGTGAAGSDGTGLVWMALSGSTAPTDTGTALAAAWKNMGGITEAGVTIKQANSTKDFKVYGSTQIQRTLVTDQKTTIDVAFAETSPFPEPSLAFHGVFADDAITARAREGVFTGGL